MSSMRNFDAELALEEEQKRLAEGAERGLTNRCNECGSLGSMEEQEDGSIRCVDCDVVVARDTRLGGLGRK